jgi:hypothetical protein
MGKPVILDSDDVECLLLASALSKEIEARVRSLQHDPQVMRLNNKIGDAFSRINRARGDAIRIEEPFDPNRDLTHGDWLLLEKLHDQNRIRVDNINAYSNLRRFRLVVMGHEVTTIKWGDKTDGALVDESQGVMYVKLTDKGRALVNSRKAITNAHN